jgi:predicted metal-dependent hydrolase
MINEGIDSFNGFQYDIAHTIWEQVWKEMRTNDNRYCLKGLIQISGSYLKCYFKKGDASEYLLRRAKINIYKYISELNQFIESDSLITDIDLLLKNKITIKVFHKVQIKKRGRLHNDLGTR